MAERRTLKGDCERSEGVKEKMTGESVCRTPWSAEALSPCCLKPVLGNGRHWKQETTKSSLKSEGP